MTLDPNKLLSSIAQSGTTLNEDRVETQFVNRNIGNVLEQSSGRSRLRFPGRFKLIMSKPKEISASSFEIRCLNCRKVISYPAWYLKRSFAVNTFHYFLCFNGKDSADIAC